MRDDHLARNDLALHATGLVKRFGDRRVVDGIDLSVPTGAVYGVLGPNGAGKTTTLRMLLGIIEPDEGSRTLRPVVPSPLPGVISRGRRCSDPMDA